MSPLQTFEQAPLVYIFEKREQTGSGRPKKFCWFACGRFPLRQLAPFQRNSLKFHSLLSNLKAIVPVRRKLR